MQTFEAPAFEKEIEKENNKKKKSKQFKRESDVDLNELKNKFLDKNQKKVKLF